MFSIRVLYAGILLIAGNGLYAMDQGRVNELFDSLYPERPYRYQPARDGRIERHAANQFRIENANDSRIPLLKGRILGKQKEKVVAGLCLLYLGAKEGHENKIFVPSYFYGSEHYLVSAKKLQKTVMILNGPDTDAKSRIGKLCVGKAISKMHMHQHIIPTNNGLWVFDSTNHSIAKWDTLIGQDGTGNEAFKNLMQDGLNRETCCLLFG